MKETSNEIVVRDVVQNIFSIGIVELELWKEAIIADHEQFNLLFRNIFSNDHKLAWRSCWIIDTITEDHPELLENRIPEIINGLIETKDGSLKRHFTRILSRYEIPDEYIPLVMDRCFTLLSPAEAPAVRVHAMQVLFNFSVRIPEFKGELASVIESLIDEGGSVGFLNRATKLLRRLLSQ